MRETILNKALDYIGLKEIRGEKHNPTILEFFAKIGHSWVQDDETAWCSAFVNYVCKEVGAKYSGKLNARSWMNVGERQPKPEKGDIAVFWRGSKTSWKGHVAFYIREDEANVYVLGGNQGNEVCIKAYPKTRLLGYRTVV